MLKIHYDLPLHRDSASRFLPWITGLMVFLGVMSLAFALVLGNAASSWSQALGSSLTVQILPLAPGKPGQDERVRQALDLLRETPGVSAARALPKSESEKLVSPWLGSNASLSDLPLPTLVDVRADGTSLNVALLRQRLDAEIPGSVLDDHGNWLGEVSRAAVTVQTLAFGALALIALTAILAVIFAVRAGLQLNRSTVELLHIMGASDRYIARQFQRSAAGNASRGGLAGLVLAVLALFAAQRIVGPQSGLPIRLALPLTDCLWLLLVPLAATFFAALTARLTVLATLKRLP
ncbi:cell division protein FtsX [Radicibacter daui]|uniref:cell division protein FtsX n=1 Tax=Radicibacter daui TaxID=3064829 RepID=UPI004046E982